MPEIPRFSGKSPAMAGIVLSFTSPEIRCICRERAGVMDGCNRVITPNQESAPPAAAVYSRASLGAPWDTSEPIAKPQVIISLFDETHTGLDCSCTSLAGKLVIRCSHVGCRTDCFTNRTCSRLHRIRWDSLPTYTARSPLDRSFSGEVHYALLRLQSLQRPHQDQEPISQKHPVPRNLCSVCTQTLAISSTLILYLGIYTP